MGHRGPGYPWVLAHPFPHRSTHHSAVSGRDETTVHGHKAAAVQGLWGENRAEMPEAVGTGEGGGASGGLWDTASLAFLKLKVEALPPSQVQSMSWP